MNERQATILIVSGVAAESNHLAEHVIQHSFRPIFARSGGEALSAIQEHSPDLLLLSLDLPEEGSIRLAERLKGTAALSTVPIVAIASTEQLGQLEYCLTLGVEDYMLLPLHPQIVRSRLIRWSGHLEHA